MSFGTSVVTLNEFTGTGPRDSMGQQGVTTDVVTAPGCRHRPLTFAETVELEFDIATEFWRTTIPTGELQSDVRAKVLAVKNNDTISIDSQTYQIIGGIRHHLDMEGRPFKATIISKKQHG